jgi:hypothetical protein
VIVGRALWTVANAVMLLAFVFSVIVQFNDPDPLLWAAIYAVAAVVCAFELRRRTNPLVPAGIAVAALIWAATIAPRVVGKVRFSAMFAEFEMANTGIEESREMYGLAFIALWMIAVAIAAWRRRSSVVPAGVARRAT